MYQNCAILVIGNEILSGRTRELNAWYCAKKLFDRGCRLAEIAVVADDSTQIIGTLNRLRKQYNAVICSGGIGPTHDDITMQAIADAFGVPLLEHADSVQRMQHYFTVEKFNDGRRRMCRLPQGAHALLCEKTIAPGACVENVFVLAGVPEIFQSQFDSICERFGGQAFLRREVKVSLPESSFAHGLAQVQRSFPDVEVGSYPVLCGKGAHGRICLSSQDEQQLEQAEQAVKRMLQQQSQSFVRVP